MGRCYQRYEYETPRGLFAARVASAIRESLRGEKRRCGTAAQTARGVQADIHWMSACRTQRGSAYPMEFTKQKEPPDWWLFLFGDPTGIRTPVTAVKGRCPRPLDDGVFNQDLCFVVEVSGIEPLTSCMPCKRSPS